MCGRYTLYTEKEVLARRFEVEIAELSPSYNVAPTQSVVSVSFEKEARVAGVMRWGLIPFWTKDETKLPQMINARVESVATRPAYREAFRRRRCLILADGFYEWQRGLGPGKRKIPHWIFREDGGPFAMAGIWSVWRRPDLERKWLRSCAIITTSANAAVSELHGQDARHPSSQGRVRLARSRARWEHGGAHEAPRSDRSRGAALTAHLHSSELRRQRRPEPDRVLRRGPPARLLLACVLRTRCSPAR